MLKKLEASSVALAGALLVNASAHAQEASNPPVHEAGLEDIVVTAQKRAEPLQEVPVSVTAVSAQTLSDFGALNTDDLNLVAPALNTQKFGTFSLPAIRGITTTNTAVGAEANVATYVDGVYRPAIFSQLADFNSIERVEVLKGPQGTLFGRNATGGAISIITRSPSTDEVAGKLSLSYGRFNEVTGAAYLNVPISSKAAFNVAVAGIHRDGYVRNIFLNRDAASVNNIAVRAKLQLEPTDSARFTITGEHADQRDLSGSASYAIDGNLAVKANAVRFGLAPAILGTRYRTTGLTRGNRQSIKTYGGAVEAELNFDGVDLISISNVLFSGIDSRLDIDQGSPDFLDFDYGPKSLSGGEDLRLQSSGDGPLTWSLGVNLFLAKDYLKPQIVHVVPFGSRTNTVARSNTSALAFYGQASYEITPAFTVTAGGRMNFEKKTAEFGGPGTALPLTRVKKKWKNVSPRIVADYKVAPETMIYASYSQGWKSGLFNPSSGSTLPADPEKLDAFEVGLKTDIGRAIRFNVAGFYYSYKDIQVSSFGESGIGTDIQNAANGRLYGIDAEVTAAFDDVFQDNDSLRLTGGGVWSDARYRSFERAVAFIPIVDPVLGLVGNTQTRIPADGNDLPQAPRVTISGNVTYEMETPSGIWSVNVNAYYNSGWYSESQNVRRFRQDAYAKIGANLGWSSPDRTYDVSLWVRNLNNAKTHALVTPNTLGTFTTAQLPRTFGIRVGYHF